MNKQEVTQHVANVHNCLVQIMVNGESTILMGDALRELRYLVQELQKDVEAEEALKEVTEVKKATGRIRGEGK